MQIYTVVIISLNSAKRSALIILMGDLLLFQSQINQLVIHLNSSLLTSSGYLKAFIVNYKMHVHLNFMH